MHLANDPNPIPDAPYLWRVLRDYIGHAFSLIGAPIEIARRFWLTRAEARAMSDVLRPLEQMLRRLIFIDALALSPPAPRTRHSARAPQPDPFNLETSETWRVSLDLRATDHTDRRRPRRHSSELESNMPARAPAIRLPNAVAAAPLALRLEALIRGFNAPERLAQRLARLLARDRRRQYAFIFASAVRDAAKPFFAQANLCAELACEAWTRRVAILVDSS